MFPLENLNLTIESIYKELLEKLTAERKIRDVSNELLALQDGDKRVLYVYDIIKEYNLIPLITKEVKCSHVSTHYRNLGNLFYQRANLYAAWQYYNLALMNSPLESQTYALAVSNRSAVFAALKKYKECLEDIKMVFSISHPEKIRDKLIKRQQQCEDALKEEAVPDLDDDSADEIFKFKAAKNEIYVSASSKLKVLHSEELGRHVVAQQNIEVGEIIVQEDPYVRVLLRSQYVFCCAYCMSRKLNLYPCPLCSVTMYCSRECVGQAYKEYHGFECPLMASLVKMNFTKLELLALRVTIKSRNDNKSWYSILGTAERAEACVNTDHWGQVKQDGKWIYDSQYYSSIHTLATNIEKRDISDIFQKCVSAAVLLHFLAAVDFVDTDMLTSVSARNYTAATLLRHLMTAPTNMHGITTNVETEEGNYVEEYNIGSAPYAFLSLINHSCTPNVVRYSRLGSAQMTLIALRPIKKGMQILDNYGYYEDIRDQKQMASKVISQCKPRDTSLRATMWACGRPIQKAHHAIHTKEERQAILRSQYKFTCLCEACVDDWPLYQNLPIIANPFPAIVQMREEYLNGTVINALQKGDRKQALKLIKPLCELAAYLEPFIPCKEAAECQEALKQCLAIISGVLPKGFNKFMEWNIPPPHIPGQPVVSRFFLGAGARDLT